MIKHTLKPCYVKPESERSLFLLDTLLAESNTEIIDDDDNDLNW